MADYILKHFDRELIRFIAKDTGDTPEVCITYIDKDALPLMPMVIYITDPWSSQVQLRTAVRGSLVTIQAKNVELSL